MIYVTVERLVKRRPEVVWEVLSDVSSLTSWSEGIVEATVASDEKKGAGMVVTIVARTKGKSVRVNCEVTAWRENALLALEADTPSKSFFHRATLDATPEGTRLGVYAEIMFKDKISGFLAHPGGIFEPSPAEVERQRMYERSVDALVKRIESLSVVPYR